MRALAVTALLLSAAHAQTASDVEIARAHYKTGEQYYQRDRFADAAREFEEAFRLSGRTELLYNIGKAYEGGGDLVKARDAYDKYLTALPSSPDAADLKARITGLDGRIGKVALTCGMPGAAVRLDGVAIGLTPIAPPIDVNPGAHTLELSLEGTQRWSLKLEVAAGATLAVTATLKPIPTETRVVLVERQAQEKKTPVYKRWWLWTAVGAVAVAGAVTGGVLATQSLESDGGLSSPLPVAR